LTLINEYGHRWNVQNVQGKGWARVNMAAKGKSGADSSIPRTQALPLHRMVEF